MTPRTACKCIRLQIVAGSREGIFFRTNLFPLINYEWVKQKQQKQQMQQIQQMRQKHLLRVCFFCFRDSFRIRRSLV
jgi:hypothetical protein